jgi:hypothetical protein
MTVMSLRNNQRAMTMNIASRMTVSGSECTRKSVNVSPARLAMMMLGGSPIRVAVPPMFEAKISAKRNG